MKRFIAFGYEGDDFGGPCGSYAGDFDTLDEVIAGVPALDRHVPGAFDNLDVLDTKDGVWVSYEWKAGHDRKPEWRHTSTSPVRDVSERFRDRS